MAKLIIFSLASVSKRKHTQVNFFSSSIIFLSFCFVFFSFTGLITIHFKRRQNAWVLNRVIDHIKAKRINITASLCALGH